MNMCDMIHSHVLHDSLMGKYGLSHDVWRRERASERSCQGKRVEEEGGGGSWRDRRAVSVVKQTNSDALLTVEAKEV